MVEDQDLSAVRRLISEVGELLAEVSEIGALIRNDPVVKEILVVLTFADRPVSGEELFRVVSERLGESGLSVSRAAFYRRLGRLVRDGIVIGLGGLSGRARQGPYMVWPGFKSTIMQVLDYIRNDYQGLVEALHKWMCLFLKSMRESDYQVLFTVYDKIIKHFEEQGKSVFYIMLLNMMRLHNVLEAISSGKGKVEDEELAFIMENLSSCPDDLMRSVIMMGQMLTSLPIIILFQLEAPLEAMYKAIIKEEC